MLALQMRTSILGVLAEISLAAEATEVRDSWSTSMKVSSADGDSFLAEVMISWAAELLCPVM